MFQTLLAALSVSFAREIHDGVALLSSIGRDGMVAITVEQGKFVFNLYISSRPLGGIISLVCVPIRELSSRKAAECDYGGRSDVSFVLVGFRGVVLVDTDTCKTEGFSHG